VAAGFYMNKEPQIARLIIQNITGKEEVASYKEISQFEENFKINT
jgi:hypothetical protein